MRQHYDTRDLCNRLGTARVISGATAQRAALAKCPASGQYAASVHMFVNGRLIDIPQVTVKGSRTRRVYLTPW
jgi:hypothetical protein